MLSILIHAGNHAAAVRVAAQHNLRQFLPLHQIDDVRDMGFQVDLWRKQVRTVRQAGKLWCENLVTLRLERLPNALPAPTSNPCFTHQDIHTHRDILLRDLSG